VYRAGKPSGRSLPGQSALSLLLVLLVSGCARSAARPTDLREELVRAGLLPRKVLLESDGAYHVDLSESEVRDLTPLRGMPISSLDLHKTRVSDLSALRGMPLKTLVLCKSRVTDLSPLAGMALTSLKVSETGVSDLSPLRGLPLKTLWIQGSNVADLSMLRGMPLKELRFSPDRVAAGLEVVRETPSLVWINQIPATAFRRAHLPKDER
jgi:hypothetical protein